MTPNELRDEAVKRCTDPQAAQAAWERVRSDPRCHGKVSRAARLAMVTVIAEGGTIKDAETAAWQVLE